jgi:hypothetical protein
MRRSTLDQIPANESGDQAMKKKSSRLTLHRETLAVLTPSPLAAAQGGEIGYTPTQFCPTRLCVTRFCPPETIFITCGAGCTVNPY